MDLRAKIVLLKGESGNSIATIEKTASSDTVDIYTITMSDGTESTFQIERGTGIESVEKTSTVGLVDTYTITFTNGETETFEVTNGESYTIPVNSVMYFEGEDLPEGFARTDPPPQFVESITRSTAQAGCDNVISTTVTVIEEE